MCVPVPVDGKSGNISPKGKVTGGFPGPTLDIVNRMMTPFRAAATGTDIEEQRKRFAQPGGLATMLTPPPPQRGPVGGTAQPRRPY